MAGTIKLTDLKIQAKWTDVDVQAAVKDEIAVESIQDINKSLVIPPGKCLRVKIHPSEKEELKFLMIVPSIPNMDAEKMRELLRRPHEASKSEDGDNGNTKKTVVPMLVFREVDKDGKCGSVDIPLLGPQVYMNGAAQLFQHNSQSLHFQNYSDEHSVSIRIVVGRDASYPAKCEA